MASRERINRQRCGRQKEEKEVGKFTVKDARGKPTHVTLVQGPAAALLSDPASGHTASGAEFHGAHSAQLSARGGQAVERQAVEQGADAKQQLRRKPKEVAGAIVSDSISISIALRRRRDDESTHLAAELYVLSKGLRAPPAESERTAEEGEGTARLQPAVEAGQKIAVITHVFREGVPPEDLLTFAFTGPQGSTSHPFGHCSKTKGALMSNRPHRDDGKSFTQEPRVQRGQLALQRHLVIVRKDDEWF